MTGSGALVVFAIPGASILPAIGTLVFGGVALLECLILGVPVGAIAIWLAPPGVGGLLPAVALLAIALPLTAGVVFLARLCIVERQALRALTIGMGARNPAHAGEPPGCRQCGGTLLTRPDHIIAICLFCRAENLLGLDLRRAATAAQSRSYELEPILSRRLEQRRAALVGLAVCALATVLVALAVLASR